MPIRHPKQFGRYLRRSIGGLERAGKRGRTNLKQAFSPVRAVIQELDALQAKPEKSPADLQIISEKLGNLRMLMLSARAARDMSVGALREGHVEVINRVAVAIALEEFRHRLDSKTDSRKVSHALLQILHPSISEEGRGRAANHLVTLLGEPRARVLIDELTRIFDAIQSKH